MLVHLIQLEFKFKILGVYLVYKRFLLISASYIELILQL